MNFTVNIEVSHILNHCIGRAHGQPVPIQLRTRSPEPEMRRRCRGWIGKFGCPVLLVWPLSYLRRNLAGFLLIPGKRDEMTRQGGHTVVCRRVGDGGSPSLHPGHINCSVSFMAVLVAHFKVTETPKFQKFLVFLLRFPFAKLGAAMWRPPRLLAGLPTSLPYEPPGPWSRPPRPMAAAPVHRRREHGQTPPRKPLRPPPPPFTEDRIGPVWSDGFS